VQAIAGDGDDSVMLGLYLWLYVGWIVALGAFLDLAAAAGWGALGMGVVALPLAARMLRS
jgi:putative membrane protein